MGCFDYFGTPFQKNVPLVYDESVSIAQQVARLFGLYCELSGNMVTGTDFASALDEIRKYVNESSERALSSANAYTDKRFDELVELLGSLDEHMRVWNVSNGKYDRNQDAIRDLFNWVTVHACTCQHLAEWGTVKQLAESGLTAYGLAVYSWWLFGQSFVPEGVFTDGTVLYTVSDARNAKNIGGYLEKQDSGPAWTVGDWATASVDVLGFVRMAGQGTQPLTVRQAASLKAFEGRVKAVIY